MRAVLVTPATVQTAFTQKNFALETVTLMFESDEMRRAAGYFIK